MLKTLQFTSHFRVKVKVFTVLQWSSVSHSVMSDSLWPLGLWPARLLCPWDSPDKNTGVGCRSLLQGIFPTQELNLGLLHCRQILYRLSYREDPSSLEAPSNWRCNQLFQKDTRHAPVPLPETIFSGKHSSPIPTPSNLFSNDICRPPHSQYQLLPGHPIPLTFLLFF